MDGNLLRQYAPAFSQKTKLKATATVQKNVTKKSNKKGSDQATKKRAKAIDHRSNITDHAISLTVSTGREARPYLGSMLSIVKDEEDDGRSTARRIRSVDQSERSMLQSAPAVALGMHVRHFLQF